MRRGPSMPRLGGAWSLVIGLVLSALATPASAQSNLRSTVDAFYPESLVAAAIESDTLPLRRHSCHAVLEEDASGNPTTIVAGYTDALRAVIRLLKKRTAGFHVVAEPEGLDLVGTECAIELVDLDGDGRSEVKLSLLQNTTSADWLFTYAGGELNNVTPAEFSRLGTLKTKLLNVDLVDITGDAIPEIVSHPAAGSDAPGPLSVYRWSSGALIQEPQPAVAVWEFTRRTGTPQTTTLTALLPAGVSGPFTLRVINGWRDRLGRLQDTVASGTISLNGVEVAGPDAFGSNVPGFERVVSLQPENRVAVRLAGTPQGRIRVLLFGTPSTTR